MMRDSLGNTGTASSPVSATTPAGPALFYSQSLDSDPGWTTEGQWSFGLPAGSGGQSGGPDPSSGYTGTKVYGYNLAGDYESNLQQKHLTSSAIDCSGRSDIHLKFWRWLGVESPSYDHAYVQVSTNGVDWTIVWENTSSIADSVWSQVDLDISAIADNQSDVYLRWTMGATDSSVQYCGWNIDDIELIGITQDTDADGMPDAWETTHGLNPGINDAAGDADGDLLSNYGEYIAGTDPSDSASYFRISTGIDETTMLPHFTVKWTAVPGRVYNVLWTPSLMQDFQPLETGIQPPKNSFTDTMHTLESSGYYRVVVMLAGYDEDGDGLPNYWENQYAVADAYADGDSDGFNNLAEFIAGTDPTNQFSFFTVTNTMAKTNETNYFVVEWTAIPNRLYSVLWTTNLLSSFQAMATDIEHPQNSYTDTTHNAESEGYYKVNIRIK